MRPSRSLRVEILAGVATLVLSLALVGGYALWQQTRAVAAIRLENQVYLRISHSINQLHSTQNILADRLENFPDNTDPNNRDVVTAGRRGQRQLFFELRARAAGDARTAAWPEDRRLLGEISAQLGVLEARYAGNQRAYERVLDALANHDVVRARADNQVLYRSENYMSSVLLGLNVDVDRRMDELARSMEREQQRTLVLLPIVTAAALAAGILMLLSAYRSLRPLAALIDRVRAVAKGDLAARRVRARPDEIGELAGEFEKMVEAVNARDVALRDKAEEIRRAEQHLEQVVDTLRAAVMVVDAAGVVSSANPAAHRIAGRSALAGRRFDETPFGGASDIAAAVATTLESAKPTTLLAARMGARALDVAVVTFAVPGGGPAGALVVADDVTEREEARSQMLQNERLAAIGRMAAHVTHEVRNPLSSMALNAEMLKDEAAGLGPKGPEVQRLVTAIQAEIDRLTGITEEYLRVARLPRPRLEREHAGDLVEEVVSFVRPEFDRAGIELLLSISDAPAAMLDEAQIRQALLNLLRNAREAVEVSGRPRRAVRVSVREERAGVGIAIADSGAGIAPEVGAKLFELFFTTKEKGSGLGLPLTREIVRAHGGTLEVDRASPDEGGGARFVIWIPRAPAQSAKPGGDRDAA